MGCSDSEGDSASDGGGSASGGGPTANCNAAQAPLGADPAAGDSFPDLEITDCSGGKITIDQLRCGNTITLMSIGAGWCQPCQEETPDLQAAYVAHQAEGLAIFQLMFQDASSLPATTLFCDAWVDEYSLTFPVFIDPVGNSLDYFQSASAPLNVIIDADGKVLWAETGKIDDVEALVTQYL
jgi:peroxiredoxin